MLYGSLLAGIALANARLGAVHGRAHPLGLRFGIPHGTVCGLLLPPVMAYNLPWAEEKYAQVARWLDALVRSAHHSTSIEGNPLSLEEVTELRLLQLRPQRLYVRHWRLAGKVAAHVGRSGTAGR